MLSLSNFPTESIYKHLAFYWDITLELLKKLIEVDKTSSPGLAISQKNKKTHYTKNSPGNQTRGNNQYKPITNLDQIFYLFSKQLFVIIEVII